MKEVASNYNNNNNNNDNNNNNNNDDDDDNTNNCRIQRRIIIAFKAANRYFLQSPHSAANCLQHVRSSGPGAIVCKSCCCVDQGIVLQVLLSVRR